MQLRIARDQSTYPATGTRTIFNGIKSENIFAAQTVPLPALAQGEILVKVIEYSWSSCDVFVQFKVRLASICMSDVHTITGQRVEPTPR